MDITRGEMVEGDLDRLIERRHDQRITSEGERATEETMDADGSDVAQVTKNSGVNDSLPDWLPEPPESRSVTVRPPDTVGPSLLLVVGALLFSGGVLLCAVVIRKDVALTP